MTTAKQSNAKPTDHTAKSAKTTKPWEQQPQESPKHYQYFQEYMNIPIPTRSIKKVQENLQEQGKKLTHVYLRQVSSDNHWQQRVRAYDSYMGKVMLTSKESNIREMNDDHFNVGKECIDSLMGDLNDPELNEVPVDKRAYVKQALIRGMEGAVRIQRLALGESTSNTRQVNEGINNLMMVLTDSKKQLQKQQKKEDSIDIDAQVIRSEK